MKLSGTVIAILFVLSLLIPQQVFSANPGDVEKHVRIHLSSVEDLKAVQKLGFQAELDIITNGMAEGFIPSDAIEQVKLLGYRIEEVQPTIEDGSIPGTRKPWYSFKDIVEILTNYCKEYPTMTAFDTIGFSIRKRPILQFKIAVLPDTAVRQRFFLNGACHGNEKIGTETVMRIIKEFLEKYSTSQRIKAIVDRGEFVFHPIINIDGFVSGRNGRRRLENNKDPNRAYGYKTEGNNSDGSLPYQWPENKTYLYSMIEAPWYQNMDYHCGIVALYTPSGSNLDRATYNRMKQIYPLGKKSDTWFDNIRGGGLAYSCSYGKCGTIALLPELCLHYPSTSKIDSLTQWNLERYLDVVDEMNRGVRGRLTNAKTGEPVYARVQVKNKGSFTFSDPRSGAFHKYVPSPSGTFEVEIMANGFKPETKSVQANTNGFAEVNVALTPDTALKYSAMSVDVIGVGNSVSLTQNRRILGPKNNSGVTIEDGFIIVDFGPKYLVTDGEGTDLTVNLTNNSSYSVSVHNDVDKIIDNEGIKLGSGQGTKSFDLNGAIDSARWVRIDAGNNASPSIDAIEADPREQPTAINHFGKSTLSQKGIKLLSNHYSKGMQFQVTVPKGAYTVSLFDMHGKKIDIIAKGLAPHTLQQQFQWNRKDLATGSFILVLKTAFGNKTLIVPWLK